MPLSNELERLVDASGVLTVYGRDENGQEVLSQDSRIVSDAEWQMTREASMRQAQVIFDIVRAQDPDLNEIRILFSNHHLMLEHEPETGRVLGVFFKKADPVVKSLARMLRRAFQRLEKATPIKAMRSPPENHSGI